MAIISLLTPELIAQLEHIVRKKIPPDKIAELDAVIAHYQQVLLMESLESGKRATGYVVKLETVGENEYRAIRGRKTADHDGEVNKLNTASKHLAVLIEKRYPPIEHILSSTFPTEDTLLTKDVTAIGEWLEQVAEIANTSLIGDKRKMKSLFIWSCNMAEIILRPSQPQQSILSGQDMKLILLIDKGLEGIKQWLLEISRETQEAIKPSENRRPFERHRRDMILTLGLIYQKISNRYPGRSDPTSKRYYHPREMRCGRNFLDFARLCMSLAGDQSTETWAIESLIKSVLPELRKRLQVPPNSRNK